MTDGSSQAPEVDQFRQELSTVLDNLEATKKTRRRMVGGFVASVALQVLGHRHGVLREGMILNDVAWTLNAGLLFGLYGYTDARVDPAQDALFDLAQPRDTASGIVEPSTTVQPSPEVFDWQQLAELRT